MHAEQKKGYAEATEIQYKETNKGIGIPPQGWRNRQSEEENKGERRGYVRSAGLCVNVVPSLEAICCDNDQILTLEWRKCSLSRTNG